MVDGDPNKKLKVKELYVRFSSDGTVNHKGFNISFVAKIDSCKLWIHFLCHFFVKQNNFVINQCNRTEIMQ